MILYIDPGTGSLLTQLAVAGVAGAVVAVKIGWRRTAALLDGRRPRDEPRDDEGDEHPAG